LLLEIGIIGRSIGDLLLCGIILTLIEHHLEGSDHEGGHSADEQARQQEEDDLDDAPVRCWGLLVENLVGTVGGEVVGQHREQHHQSGKVQEESQPEVVHHSLGTTHEHVGDVGQEVAHRGPGDESGEDEALEDVI